MRPRKKVSQQRIAKDLGVSQALVSLALNGRKEVINPDTYRQIWEHALNIGYQPKGMLFEQTPREARLRQVGFILRAGLNIHTQGSYFSHVLHGLHTALAARDHAAVFLGSEDTLDKSKLGAFFHTGHSLRGVVLFGEVSTSFLRQLRTLEPRVVAVSSRHPGLCHSVIGNEPQALESIVRHLHELGHRSIGWLGGNAGLARHEARYQAYQVALRQFGLAFDQRYAVALKEGDRAEGTEAMLGMLGQKRRKDFPTAFITYNTHMAIGAVKALLREGWKVPADLSIAAADYSQTAVNESPRVTAAGCDPEKLGAAAARLVVDSTGEDDESLTELVLPSQLAVGETTGPASR